MKQLGWCTVVASQLVDVQLTGISSDNGEHNDSYLCITTLTPGSRRVEACIRLEEVTALIDKNLSTDKVQCGQQQVDFNLQGHESWLNLEVEVSGLCCTHWAWLARSWLAMIWLSSEVSLVFMSSKYCPSLSRSAASWAKVPVGFQREREKKISRGQQAGIACS